MDQRDLLLAQNHLIKNKNSNETSSYDHIQLIESQQKNAFKKVYNNISIKSNITGVIESFISEKSFDTENLNENKNFFLNEEKVKNHKIKDEIVKTMKEISDTIMKYKIDNLTAVDYESEFKNSKIFKIEPGMDHNSRKKKLKGISSKNYKFKF